MLVENQLIKVFWNPKTKHHYESLGYKFTKFNDKFYVTPIELPIGSSKIVKVICDYCNNEFSTSYSHYYKSTKSNTKIACQKCTGIKVAENTLEERQNYMYQKLVDFCIEHNYILLTDKHDIKNNETKIKYICPIHGEYETKVTSILQNKLCYKCSRQLALKNKNKTTLAERQNILYTKCLNVCNAKKYTLISNLEEIKNNTTYVKYLCPVHGKQSMRISNLINGRSCPKCADDIKRKKFNLPLYEVEKRIKNAGGILLNKEDYINNDKKNLKILCPECKTPFVTFLQKFTQHGSQVCPKCSKSESIGEKKIRHYLEEHKINFITQKWFKDCRDINPLPFDFYLPDKNTIIEFDGRQHFGETNYFSYSYEKTKAHDEIKNEYCKKNNIKLIRIPFWNYNKIESILQQKIS